ncbi:MAG: hypothetical protein IKZ88_05975, partial [Neisseriaceae bacterium]|nr:hypothetical protein [Neisseriaceae bacterium]
MNKQYRVIFNHQRNQFMVVSEDTHSCGKSSCRSTVLNNAGEVALRTVMTTAAVLGATTLATPAAADTWNVTSSNTLDNFFRPGKTSTLKGSAGFFDANGSADAVKIVTGQDGKKLTNINLGAAGDTTNLQNMLESIKIVRHTNELREKEKTNAHPNGSAPLKINDRLMAISQVQTGYARSVVDHSGMYNVAENLAWYPSATAAVDGWYNEKSLCPNNSYVGCEFNGDTGHYINMTAPNYTVTGAAVGSWLGTQRYGGTQGAVYSSSGEPSFTPDEYQSLLETYINTGWVFKNADQIVNIENNLGSGVRVAGGYAIPYFDAKNNAVNMTNGAVGTVYGGYAVQNNTEKNTVTISSGAAGTVYGGFSENTQATHTNNAVNIQGGAVANVYLANAGTVNGGTVNFTGGKVGNLKVFENSGTATNTVLNIGESESKPVAMNSLEATGEVGGFNTYNFFLPDTVQSGETALEAGSANIDNATINAYLSGASNINNSTAIHLIHTTNGITGTPKQGEVKVGVTLTSKIAVNGKDLDLSFSGGSSDTPITQDPPTAWNVWSRTEYSNNVSGDDKKFQITGDKFNDAKNTANATVNVKPNNDYKSLIIYGSDQDGLTMTIDDAKGLGAVDTGTGSLKKLTMNNSSAKAVKVNTAQAATVAGGINVHIKSSEMDSFTTVNGDWTANVNLSNVSVGNVDAQNNKTLTISSSTGVGNVNADGTQNLYYSGVNNNADAKNIRNLKGQDGKKVLISSSKVNDVQIDTLKNSQVNINGSKLNSFTSQNADVSSEVKITASTVEQNVVANDNTLTISNNTTVKGNVFSSSGVATIDYATINGEVHSTGSHLTIQNTDKNGKTTVGSVRAVGVNNVALIDNATVTGNVAYSGRKTLTIQNNAQVGGTVKTDNTDSTVSVNNATVQDIDVQGKALTISNKAKVSGSVKSQGGTDGTVLIENATVTGSVNTPNEQSLTIKNAQTGDIIASQVRGNDRVITPKVTIENSTVGNITNINDNDKGNGNKTITITDTTAQAVNIDTKDNSTVNVKNSTIDNFKSFYSDNTSSVSFNGGKVIGNVEVNNNQLSIDGTNVGGVVTVAHTATIKNATIGGDINSAAANNHNANLTISDSSTKGVYGKVVNIQNSDANGTVYAYQLDMALNNNTVDKVWVNSYNSQKTNVDSTITGTGTIGSIAFNPADANSRNAVGTLNTNGNITVSGSLSANDNSTLKINADKGSLKAGSLTGWKAIDFANLSADYAALQLTGADAVDLGDKITLSGSLNDYNNGKKYSLIQAANAVTVSDNLFAQNTVTDNVFNILSDAQYEVKEFGFHQDDAKKSLYIADETGKRNIINKQFNAADNVKNAVVNINKSGDYQGLNISGGGTDSTINWTWGRNLGVIDGKGGTLNIGTAQTATQMNQRTAANIRNVEALNFYLPSSIQNGEWAVSLSSQEKTDLGNTAITAYLAGDSNINDQDTVHLITKPNGGIIAVGSNNQVIAKQGVTLTATAEMKLSDSQSDLDLVFTKASDPTPSDPTPSDPTP